MQPVIAALELDNFVATRSGPSQANRMHRSFGTAVAEAAHLDGKARTNFLRQFPLHVMRHAIRRALVQPAFACLDHGRMRMPRHKRAKTKVMVKVLVAIKIPKLAARSFRY